MSKKINKVINILGMHCASCAQNIKINLEKNSNILSVDVNFATKKASVNYYQDKISFEEIHEIIRKTGYDVLESDIEKNDLVRNVEEKNEMIKVFVAIILTLPLFVRMFWMWELPYEIMNINLSDWIQLFLSFIVVFGIGMNFHVNSVKALKNRQTNMDTLISLGTLSAFFYSLWAMFNARDLYFESASTITALILLGKFLELKSKNRASKAMEKLLELGVKKARVINKEGLEQEIDINMVKVGDILLIKPSEKIPLDGIVIEGNSTVDESMLTGESVPVVKQVDKKVFAATINQDGVIKIKVTTIGEGTVYAQIIKAVENAQNFKPPIQRLADKISGIFVPVVMGLSLLTLIAWMIISGDIETSMINAVAVLIISCPCALGIATPIAVMVGTSVGAKNGILIKDGESFEKAKKADTIIFDKTGTLTSGKLSVTNVFVKSNGEFKEDYLKRIAYSLSKNSEHPISKAITKYLQDEIIDIIQINNFNEQSGKGIIAEIEFDNRKIMMGNKQMLLDNNISDSWIDEIINQQNNIGTTIYVATEQKVVGALLLSDELKSGAKEVINEIKKMNLKPILISGDSKNVVEYIAKYLGIDYLAEVLPHEKQNEVKKLQAKGKQVIFVGDGINDAPSLIQADLGIAMGSGTDIAKESGSIIIMKNELSKIIEAINLSRKTFTIIKQNLFWAFFYNAIAIPLAMFGLVNPMIGAFAMGLSDVTVIGNSLRIYSRK